MHNNKSNKNDLISNAAITYSEPKQLPLVAAAVAKSMSKPLGRATCTATLADIICLRQLQKPQRI